MENSNSINIGTKMCGANLHCLDVKHAPKKQKTITVLSSILYLPAGYCKCFSKNFVICCVRSAFNI